MARGMERNGPDPPPRVAGRANGRQRTIARMALPLLALTLAAAALAAGENLARRIALTLGLCALLLLRLDKLGGHKEDSRETEVPGTIGRKKTAIRQRGGAQGGKTARQRSPTSPTR